MKSATPGEAAFAVDDRDRFKGFDPRMRGVFSGISRHGSEGAAFIGGNAEEELFGSGEGRGKIEKKEGKEESREKLFKSRIFHSEVFYVVKRKPVR
jgi:hypothetical protein